VVYTLTVTNSGPSAAAAAAWSDVLPAGTHFRALSSAAGWSCMTPAVGDAGTVSCSNPAFAPGSAMFGLTLRIETDVAGGTVVSNVATLSSATPDPDSVDLSASADTTVAAPASVTVTKTVAGDFVAGGTIFYTIVMANAGPNTQADNPGDELTDDLPAELTPTDATASSGTATTSANTVRWNGSIPAGGTVTITIEAVIFAGTPAGSTLDNQAAYAYDADGDGTNEAAGMSDDPALGGTADPTSLVLGASVLEIPTLGGVGLTVLALLLSTLGVVVLLRKGPRG
jgi:uncharacterized repeat protein (TIGR01451 family)